MKFWIFAKRNLKELSRDPLSYIFCIACPILLILVFQMINHYTPEAYWFQVNNLTPGICVFSLSFVMLFMTILVSKDKTSSFLNRMISMPVKAVDYIFGYMLPGIIIGLAQLVVCCLFSFIVSAIAGTSFNFGLSLVAIIALIPTLMMFVSVGIMFGILFSDKSAPGMCSFIITVSGFVSGAWMPLETLGTFCTVAKCLPFYPATLLGRAITNGVALTFESFWGYLLITLGYALILIVVSLLVFSKKLFGDKK